MQRPISSEDLGSTIAVGQKCTAAQLPALEDATPALLCWAPSQSEIGIYVCLPRNLRRDVATLGSENDRPGDGQGPPRRVPCPNNCGMMITWHATHCCHSCQYHPGRHGPQCERLEAPGPPDAPSSPSRRHFLELPEGRDSPSLICCASRFSFGSPLIDPVGPKHNLGSLSVVPPQV